MILDQLEARLWADYAAKPGAWVRRIIDQTRATFEILVRARYDAPWQAAAGRCDGPADRCRA